MGGKSNPDAGGLVRQGTDTFRKASEKVGGKIGKIFGNEKAGSSFGKTFYTFFNTPGTLLEGGAMVEDMARAPGVAKKAAKKAQAEAQAEQDKLLGAAKQREKDEKILAEASMDTAARFRSNQAKRKSGRAATILTDSGSNLNQTLGSSSGSTLLGS